jgi:hypothetical protein
MNILVTGLFLLSVWGTPVYAQELPPPPPVVSVVATSSPEWIKGRIHYYADLYSVSEDIMNAIVKCESGYNPNARHVDEEEYSIGLVQINLIAHPSIDEYDAKAPNFALSFLAQNLANGNGNIWTCYKMIAQ